MLLQNARLSRAKYAALYKTLNFSRNSVYDFLYGMGRKPYLTLSSAKIQPEGDGAATLFTWILTLNRNGSTEDFNYSYEVTGFGPNPADPADFGGTYPSGSNTFYNGLGNGAPIVIAVTGDTAFEPSESFRLTVTASGLNTVSSIGIISNDDLEVQPPVGTLTPSVNFQTMRATAPTGTNLLTVESTSDLIISPNDGRVVVGTPLNGVYPINKGATASSANTVINLSINNGSKTVNIPISVENGIDPRSAFRNVVDAPPEQWEYDIQLSEVHRMHDNVSLGSFTHTQIKDGDSDDPTIWNTGTVPHQYNPVAKQVFNWRKYLKTGDKDSSWDTIMVGTAVVNTAGYHLRIKSDFFVKHIHGGSAGMIEVFAPQGQSIRIIRDTLMAHGRWWAHAEGPDYSTDGTPRIGITGCRQTVPDASMLGTIMLMGPRRWFGTPMSTSLFSVGNIAQGARTITFPNGALQASGWRVGQVVVLPATDPYTQTSVNRTLPNSPAAVYLQTTNFGQVGTGSYYAIGKTNHYSVSNHQYAIIESISGNSITLDRDNERLRKVYSETLKGQTITDYPEVINISRSIEMDSADPFTIGNRDCYMGCIHPDSEMWYVGHNNMGQTVLDGTLTSNDGSKMWNGPDLTTSINNPINVPGKYANHEHYLFNLMRGRPAITVGCSAANASKPFHGVGFRTHGTDHIFDYNAMVDFTAIGWGAEDGFEPSQVSYNVAVGVTGSGYEKDEINGSISASEMELYVHKLNGNTGTAFDCQSRNTYCRGNRVYGSNLAWNFVQQPTYIDNPVVRDYNRSTPPVNRMPYTDPLCYRIDDNYAAGVDGYQQPGQGRTAPTYRGYSLSTATIPCFEDNVVVGCRQGMKIGDRDRTDRTNQQSVEFINNRFWDNKSAIYWFSYINNYIFGNNIVVWTGNAASAAQAGVYIGGNGATWNIIGRDNAFRGYSAAWNILSTARGHGIIFKANEYKNGIAPFLSVGWAIIPEGDGKVRVRDSNNNVVATYNTPQEHHAYRLMDDWWSLDLQTKNPTSWGSGVYERVFRDITDADMNQNGAHGYPFPQLGGFRATLPSYCSSANGFYFKPGTVPTYIHIQDANLSTRINLYGTIVDTLGQRDFGTSDNVNLDGTVGVETGRSPVMSAYQLCKWNGIWNDGGTWKVPLWFSNVDRLTRASINARIDVPVDGLTSDIISTLTVISNPNDTCQTDRLERMIPKASPIVLSTVAPKITAAPSVSINAPTGLVYNYVIKTDTPWCKWTLSGTNASLFEVVYANRVNTLRSKAALTTGEYDLTLTVTDPITGLSSSRNIHFSVSTALLEDNFSYVGDVTTGPLAAFYFGNDGLLYSNGDGTATFGLGSASVVVGHDTGSVRHFVEWTAVNGNGVPTWMGWGNWTYINAASGYQESKAVDGNGGDQQSHVNWVAGDVVRVELDGVAKTLTLKINGVAKFQRPSTNNPGTAVAFYGAFAQPQGAVIRNLRCGPLA